MDDRARPFRLPAGPAGALLLHGFTGSPFELKGLAEHLAAGGITVSAALLAGHGTSPADLARTSWPQWLASAAAALRELRAAQQQVFICGFSLGALVALNLAADPATAPLIDGLVLINCPVIVGDRRLPFAHLLKWFRPFLPAGVPSNPDVAARLASYDRTPLAAAAQIWRLMRRTRRLLPQVKPPALIIQGDRDTTVNPASGPYLRDHLGSARVEFVWATGRKHLVPVEPEREQYFARILAFLQSLSG